MKKTELIKLKKLLQQEINRRNRINKLLENKDIQEFLSLNHLNFDKFLMDDKWMILSELLKDFKITESQGILVCTGSFVIGCIPYYQESEFYEKEVSLDKPYRFRKFEDIETKKEYKAYNDQVIRKEIEKDYKSSCRSPYMTCSEYCYKHYRSYLESELMNQFIILIPNHLSKNKKEFYDIKSENKKGFYDIKKDYFMTAIEQGQPKAKQFVLSKYSRMK